MDKALARVELAREHLSELRARVAKLRLEVERLEWECQERRQKGMAARRTNWAGQELPVLESKSGKIFRVVRIDRVTEIGVEFHHVRGLARLTAADLTERQREEFGLDATRSRELARRERAQAASWERQADALAAVRQKRTGEADAKSPMAPVPSSSAGLSSATVSSPLHEKPRALGVRRRVVSSRPRYYYVSSHLCRPPVSRAYCWPRLIRAW